MIHQLSAEAAATVLRDDPKAVYLDVRSEPEYQAGHAAGAYNVPVFFLAAGRSPAPNPEFEQVVQALLPKDAKIVVGCQSGVRSQTAAEILERLGYRDVSNLAPGFGGARNRLGEVVSPGWKDAGLPVEHGNTPGRCWPDLQEKR